MYLSWPSHIERLSKYQKVEYHYKVSSSLSSQNVQTLQQKGSNIIVSFSIGPSTTTQGIQYKHGSRSKNNNIPVNSIHPSFLPYCCLLSSSDPCGVVYSCGVWHFLGDKLHGNISETAGRIENSLNDVYETWVATKQL